ncbi:peptide chain release factor 3 [Reyranella sp.]|uniref:peptide chain release factor 3 n=1 Tax=Reyranella sp. TaxID=1929291 RepID=UPI001201CA5C|nr:peptide chain release factor 3 [Reyranella sp.]TAJ90569.1 MAG: peptide chain release factor 3 [Reyranella sp.]
MAGHPAGLRRTFAIISHPDAGKTTLTEKLLLFGGAIHVAGAVKARGEARRARSDWMKIEQQRGISVTTSVMHFEYGGAVFNLLDTPGHEDFSEDTYRTLTAVDSAVMVIDAAKGIEARTRKLFEICRLRDVPIVTFINKMDRESKDPIELLDEIASTLALDVTPMSWPAGSGQTFKGTYDLANDRMLIFDAADRERIGETVEYEGIEDPALAKSLPAEQYAKLAEDVELVRAGYPAFEIESYRGGHLTPVFFGSAYNNFGVRELLDALAAWAPPPRPQPAEPRPIEPTEPKVSGFVFKVQANMDPNHRDRIAFLRLCSGKFRRGMKLTQMGTGKTLSVNSPILFFAREREIVDEAWPGDIIGVPNHGVLRVGDTLTEGETIKIVGIPNFAPEILRRVRLEDPMKSKQLKRALDDLAEEGVTQVFRRVIGGDHIVGVVGELQLDVLKTRVEAEYQVKIDLEPAPFETARWISAETKADLEAFMSANRGGMSEDRDGSPVFLARNAWELGYIAERSPKIKFSDIRERS